METTSLRTWATSPVQLDQQLITKLSPSRFPQMTGKMAAIVGCVLGVAYTSPTFEEIVVTSDGFALARCTGEFGANFFIGTYPDLRRNWVMLLNMADLTTDELFEAEMLFAARIGIRQEYPA